MAPNDNISTSRWRRNRASANLLDQTSQPAPRPANMNSLKPAPKLERAPSRMSLFNLFSKPKVEKARGHTEVGMAVPMQPHEPSKSLPASPPKSSLRSNPPPQAQQVQRMRSGQILRPPSMRPPNIIPPPGNDDWDPPPLFQAYPQSIKYATVQACVYSSDALLRTQSQRRQAESLRERMDSHRDLSATLDNSSEHRKLEKTHKRLDSILDSSPKLTNKIYVLVTSGHVLQYSGDGSFDRLPERVLRLGKDSAAFASDLIPGKHWVLQILQSANEDGTVTAGPKHSLLSRLRLQSNTRKAATSFLLVMESAEEMESWMTTVRREIENLGGMKTSSESSRASSSTDGSSEKPSAVRPYQRQPPKHESSRLSKATPIDSPLQSQYSGSPKIVTSNWETDRKENKNHMVDSASMRSSRRSLHRQSVEAAHIATAAISHEQLQLDQLHEPSRYSYVSTGTSISGTGTRVSSRDPSPTSPLRESPPADVEPHRSATSLRSFHMNPGTSSTRRRSMQPLPVTNENSSLSVSTHPTSKRHSIYGPNSPPILDPSKESRASDHDTSMSPSTPANAGASLAAPTTNRRPSNAVQPQTSYPARYALRSSSAPPLRNELVSPSQPGAVPDAPAARPQSTLVSSLTAAAQLSNPPGRRMSATPKPFLRPLPVRPQTQKSDGSYVVPRRSSLTPGNGPAPLPLGIVVNRSVTAPVRPPSAAANASPQGRPNSTLSNASAGQSLRRPTSVQIRSDPAPFLSSSRPNRAVSSTPSFVPGNRAASNTPSFVPANRASGAPTPTLRQSTSNQVLRGHGAQLAPPKIVASRRSMPAMGLPPPAPPPNMPLPPPPPVAPPRTVVV